MPSSEQLEQRQQQLEQRFDTFSTAFTGFSDHFYSVFLALVPPLEFYPHQPFYPPPPRPPPMDWPSWQLMPKGEMDLGVLGSRGNSWTSLEIIRFCFRLLLWFSLCWTLFMPNYVALHAYFIVLHGFVAWIWTWLVICDELRWFVILLSIYVHLVACWGCANIVKFVSYIYILYVVCLDFQL